MEERCLFHSFISKAINMPHIGEVIIKHLGPVDVAHCLRTNRTMRQFVTSTLHWSKQLQSDMDEAASRLSVTSGYLKPINFGPLKDVNADLAIKQSWRSFCCGFDGFVWMVGSMPKYLFEAETGNSSFDDRPRYLYAFSLKDARMVKKVPFNCGMSTNIGIRILPGSKVLIQDSDKVMLFAPSGAGSGSVKKASEKTHRQWGGMDDEDGDDENDRGCVSSCTVAELCIFDCVKLVGDGEGEEEEENDPIRKKTFYRDDGNGGLVEKFLDCPCAPKIVIEEGRFLMIRSMEGITTLDKDSLEIIWSNKNIPVLESYQTFLTEVFCGFIYVVYEVKEIEVREIGHFKILLFDSKTGQEIYHEKLWDFSFISTDEYQYHDGDNDFHPDIAVHGNYLFALSTHRRAMKANVYEEGGGDTFLCIKVNSNDMSCKVRFTSVGLECVLSHKSRKDERREIFHRNMENWTYEARRLPPSGEADFLLFGFAYDSLVVGYFSFEFDGLSSKFHKAKTVFSVNLDMVLDLHEPSATFAAVHFPLNQSVLLGSYSKDSYSLNDEPFPDYYPHYETDDRNQVKLTGVVEALGDCILMLFKLHSFKRTVEAKDLPSATNSKKQKGLDH